MKQVAWLLPLVAALVCNSSVQAGETAEVKKSAATAQQEATPAPGVDRKAGIRAKSAQEQKIYSREQLQDIEQLYQSANRDLRSPEAKPTLLSLIEKYPKANRSGCALLYLGQSAEGAEKEQYLKRAMADFGDCFYGDGVQVGAYARFVLGYYYQSAGKATEAKALFDAIRKDFPEAINHKGKLLTELLPK